MTKLRRIDWYHDEWLVGTGGLTLEERGFYDTIINLIYSTGGPIRMNDRELAFRSNCDPRTVRRLTESLRIKGKIRVRVRGEDGVNLGEDEREIGQSRAEDEIKIAQRRVEDNRKNGQKGGRPSNKINELVKPNGSGDQNPTTTTTTTTIDVLDTGVSKTDSPSKIPPNAATSKPEPIPRPSPHPPPDPPETPENHHRVRGMVAVDTATNWQGHG